MLLKIAIDKGNKRKNVLTKLIILLTLCILHVHTIGKGSALFSREFISNRKHTRHHEMV